MKMNGILTGPCVMIINSSHQFKATSARILHSNTHGKYSTATSSTKNTASDFRKGIKRFKFHYKELNDQADWDDWERSVAAHGCEPGTDSKYVPKDQDELNPLRKCKSLCMMSLLARCILPWGLYMFIKTLENSQAVWKDYLSYMRTSTKADMAIEDLMSLSTSVRLTSSHSRPILKICYRLAGSHLTLESLVPSRPVILIVV